MKFWRSKLARLNQRFDTYIKENYKVVDYEVKNPSPRMSSLTWRPYGYYRKLKMNNARRRCIISKGMYIIEAMSAVQHRRKRMEFDTDSYEILIDNCCSHSLTNDINDFIEPPVKSKVRIRGYNGQTTSTMVGTVKWKIQDDNGKIHNFILPETYYSPTVETRLLSPQHWAQVKAKKRDAYCITYYDAIIMRWNKDKYQITAPLDDRKHRNVGVMRSMTGIKNYLTACTAFEQEHETIAFPVTINTNEFEEPAIVTDDEANVQSQELNQPSNDKEEEPKHDQIQMREKPIEVTFEEDTDVREEYPVYDNDKQEYMHWHYKLNHPTHTVLVKMAFQNMLPRRITKILKDMDKDKIKPPMCNDCYGAKATRKPWRTKGDKLNRSHIKKAVNPGDVVSVDQLESSIPGFIGQITGKLTRQRIIGSTVYVDHASDLSYVYHQTSMTSEETVKSKLAFEKYAASHGVHIKHYHADNGRFKDNLFMKSVEDERQTISFCGVGAHHQNGIAEKRIGDLQRRATTLLLHAQRRWPDAINSHLWTYAIRAANDCRNYTPTNTQDICPMSRFCKTNSIPSFQNQHHFGCPTYVLKKELQDKKKMRKWTDRTRVGINLGYSSRHAHNVSLILNLQTGLVSPQYHCSYDDLFETTTGTQARSIPISQWQFKAGFTNEKPKTDTEEEAKDEWEEEDQIDENEEGSENEEVLKDTYITRYGRTSKPPERLLYDAQACLITPNEHEELESWCEQHLLAYKASTDPDTMYYHQAMKEPDKEKFQAAMEKECSAHYKEGNYKLIKRSKLPEGATLLSSVWQMKRKRKPSTGEISKYKARMNVDGSKMIKGLHYEETYAPVVQWATIRFFITMAILNNWHTRQLDFVLAYTQADIERDLYMKLPPGFTIPGKVLTDQDRKEYVLKLEKNLYGQKQAGRVWYLHLKKNLIKLGFTPSEHDECVFYHGSTIFIVYTDDTILLGPNKKEIEDLVEKLAETFKIEDQGDLSDYLGIKIERKEDGTLEWTQPTLIQSILKDLKLDGEGFKNKPKVRTIPASSTVVLTDHADSKDHNPNEFDYRHVIGKLLYLEKSTRPDISCAVHQCARHCANPKVQHTIAIKRIGRYLLGTKDKGLIMRPNQEGMECWVDAAHASEWNNKTASDDSSSARSRMGYIITYAGCPMHWTSKMQTEIALSTTEAEYIALSQSMREVLPIIWLLEEARQFGIPVLNAKPKVHCKVFEDNAGAIEIANVPKMRPRTKHLNIKYHHFREEVRKGTVSIYYTRTEDQIADIFTKPLPEISFMKFRERIMGW